jgi:E3 UFM1-protein ligase 1
LQLLSFVLLLNKCTFWQVVRLQNSGGYVTQQKLQADITAALKRKSGRIQMSVLQARLGIDKTILLAAAQEMCKSQVTTYKEMCTLM